MHDCDELTSTPRHGLFAYLPENEWHRVCQTGVRVRFDARDLIIRQGDTSQHVHVILGGCVKITRTEAHGNRAILTLRAAGDVLGDMAAVDKQPRSATVTALTATFTQLLTGEQFRRFLARPDVASGFAAYTVSRLRSADDQRTEMALLPVRQRLARALLQLDAESERLPGGRQIRLSQTELAELVGASRNAVVAELTSLRDTNVVATSRREVTVLDASALRRACMPPARS